MTAITVYDTPITPTPENPSSVTPAPGNPTPGNPTVGTPVVRIRSINTNDQPPPTPSAIDATAQKTQEQPLRGGEIEKRKLSDAEEAAEAGVWWQQRHGKEISSVDDLRNHIVGRVLREGLNAKDRQQIAAWRARNEASEDKPTATGGGPTLADIEREAKPGETYEQVRLRLLRDRDRTTIDKLAAGTVERKTAALKDGRRIS